MVAHKTFVVMLGLWSALCGCRHHKLIDLPKVVAKGEQRYDIAGEWSSKGYPLRRGHARGELTAHKLWQSICWLDDASDVAEVVEGDRIRISQPEQCEQSSSWVFELLRDSEVVQTVHLDLEKRDDGWWASRRMLLILGVINIHSHGTWRLAKSQHGLWSTWYFEAFGMVLLFSGGGGSNHFDLIPSEASASEGGS